MLLRVCCRSRHFQEQARKSHYWSSRLCRPDHHGQARAYIHDSSRLLSTLGRRTQQILRGCCGGKARCAQVEIAFGASPRDRILSIGRNNASTARVAAKDGFRRETRHYSTTPKRKTASNRMAIGTEAIVNVDATAVGMRTTPECRILIVWVRLFVDQRRRLEFFFSRSTIIWTFLLLLCFT